MHTPCYGSACTALPIGHLPILHTLPTVLSWLLSNVAKSFTVDGVSGCSFPGAFSLPSKACRSISLVSSYLPWLLSNVARSFTLGSASGYTFPSTFSLPVQNLPIHLLSSLILPLQF